MIEWTIHGLRDALGRFASMSDADLLVRRFAHAEELAHEVSEIYRRNAPRSKEQRSEKEEREPFAESIHGEAHLGGAGFLVGMMTAQPELAGWLKHGTRPHLIEPRQKKALHWTSSGGDFFAKSVQHPGTSPNKWEEKAYEEAAIVMREHGNKIGSHVTRYLAGHE